MKEIPFEIWCLLFLFFAVEVVICLERASKSSKKYHVCLWCMCAVAGLYGFGASYAYAH